MKPTLNPNPDLLQSLHARSIQVSFNRYMHTHSRDVNATLSTSHRSRRTRARSQRPVQSVPEDVLVQHRAESRPNVSSYNTSRSYYAGRGKCSNVVDTTNAQASSQGQTYPQHLTLLLSSRFNPSMPSFPSRQKSGWSRTRCHASTGVISPSRLMLDDRFSSSLMTEPLAVQLVLNWGASGARAMRGVEAIIMWLAGSAEGGSW